MAGETVEGADLALVIGPTIESLVEQGQMNPSSLPLANAIINAICHDQFMQIPWKRFYQH